MLPPTYRKTACCGVLAIRHTLNLRAKDGRVEAVLGHVGVCPKCLKPCRPPKVYRSAPAGYRELWGLLGARPAVSGLVYDVEVSDGVLVPYGMTVAETRAAQDQARAATQASEPDDVLEDRYS